MAFAVTDGVGSNAWANDYRTVHMQSRYENSHWATVERLAGGDAKPAQQASTARIEPVSLFGPEESCQLREQLEEVRKALQTAKSALATSEADRRQLQTTCKSVSLRLERLMAAEDEQVRELRDQLRALQLQVRDRDQLIEQLRQSGGSAQQHAVLLTQKQTDWERRLREERSERHRASKSLGEEQRKRTAAEGDAQRLQKRCGELEQQLREAERREREVQQQHSSTLSALQSQLAAAQRANDDLQRRATEIQRTESVSGIRVTEFATVLESKLSELRQIAMPSVHHGSVHEAAELLAAARQEAESRVQQIQRQLDAERESGRQLQQQVAEGKAAAERLKRHLAQQSARRQSDATAHAEHVARLTAALEEMAAQRQHSELARRSELEMLRAQEMHQSRFSAAEGLEALATLRSQLDEARHQLQREQQLHTDAAAKSEAAVALARERGDELLRRVHELETKVAEAERARHETDTRAIQSSQQLAAKGEELASLRATVKFHEQQIEALRAAKEHAEGEAKEVRRQLQEVDAHRQQQVAAVQDLRAALQAAEQVQRRSDEAAQQWQSRHTEQTAALVEARQQLQGLALRLEQQHEAETAARMEIAGLQARVKQQTERCDHLGREALRMEAEGRQLRERTAQANEELRRAREDECALDVQLQQCRKKLQQLCESDTRGEELEKHKKRLEEERQAQAQTQRQRDELLQQAERQLAEARRQCNVLTGREQELRESLCRCEEERQVLAARAESREREATDLRAEIAGLRGQISQVALHAVAKAQSTDDQLRLADQERQLLAAHAAAHAAEMAELRRKLREQEAEKEALEDKSEETAKQLRVATVELEASRTAEERLRTECSDLQEQLGTKLAELSELQMRAHSRERQSAETSQRCEALQAELEALVRRLELADEQHSRDVAALRQLCAEDQAARKMAEQRLIEGERRSEENRLRADQALAACRTAERERDAIAARAQGLLDISPVYRRESSPRSEEVQVLREETQRLRTELSNRQADCDRLGMETAEWRGKLRAAEEAGAVLRRDFEAARSAVLQLQAEHLTREEATRQIRDALREIATERDTLHQRAEHESQLRGAAERRVSELTEERDRLTAALLTTQRQSASPTLSLSPGFSTTRAPFSPLLGNNSPDITGVSTPVTSHLAAVALRLRETRRGLCTLRGSLRADRAQILAIQAEMRHSLSVALQQVSQSAATERNSRPSAQAGEDAVADLLRLCQQLTAERDDLQKKLTESETQVQVHRAALVRLREMAEEADRSREEEQLHHLQAHSTTEQQTQQLQQMHAVLLADYQSLQEHFAATLEAKERELVAARNHHDVAISDLQRRYDLVVQQLKDIDAAHRSDQNGSDWFTAQFAEISRLQADLAARTSARPSPKDTGAGGTTARSESSPSNLSSIAIDANALANTTSTASNPTTQLYHGHSVNAPAVSPVPAGGTAGLSQGAWMSLPQGQTVGPFAVVSPPPGVQPLRRVGVTTRSTSVQQQHQEGNHQSSALPNGSPGDSASRWTLSSLTSEENWETVAHSRLSMSTV